MSLAATSLGGRTPADVPNGFVSNRLLATFGPSDRAALEQCAELVRLERGETLVEAGSQVAATIFPCTGAIVSLVLLLEDGRTVDVATVGNEGAISGIVSCGCAPAFARAVVQTSGYAIRIDVAELEALKTRSAAVRDLFCRYADAFLAQVMQSVACNAYHHLEARLCRWLLTVGDRVGESEIRLTQEDLAQMLGVQRTTVTAVVRKLQARGLIRQSRGSISLLDRQAIEDAACECYDDVRAHFGAVLPEVRPQQVVDRKIGA